MRKIFLSTLALAALTSNVYASKARILALGEEAEDNFFVMDSRYIFTNASYANEYANNLFIEWGDKGVATALDDNTSPKAMGGFLMKSGSYTYGAYLGNESNVSSFLRILASEATASNSTSMDLPTSDNQIDLFFAGGADVKWGANLVYAASETKETGKEKIEDNAMALRLGAHTDAWDGFANISLVSDAENKNLATKNKFEGKLGFQVGGSYTMDSKKFHASLKKFDWEQSRNNVKTDGGFTRIDAGMGNTYKVTDSGSVFTRVQFSSINVQLDYAAGKAELDRTVVPFVIGYEGKATSWLTLRGSLSHNLYSNVKSKNLGSIPGATTASPIPTLQYLALATYNGSTVDSEATIANSTSVNAGATLAFGNLEIDGFIGASPIARNAGATDSGKKQGVLATDNLLTRVGMTYKF